MGLDRQKVVGRYIGTTTSLLEELADFGVGEVASCGLLFPFVCHLGFRFQE
jgi:hypothetical protein